MTTYLKTSSCTRYASTCPQHHLGLCAASCCPFCSAIGEGLSRVLLRDLGATVSPSMPPIPFTIPLQPYHRTLEYWRHGGASALACLHPGNPEVPRGTLVLLLHCSPPSWRLSRVANVTYSYVVVFPLSLDMFCTYHNVLGFLFVRNITVSGCYDLKSDLFFSFFCFGFEFTLCIYSSADAVNGDLGDLC
jgi:hypothetical protein